MFFFFVSYKITTWPLLNLETWPDWIETAVSHRIDCSTQMIKHLCGNVKYWTPTTPKLNERCPMKRATMKSYQHKWMVHMPFFFSLPQLWAEESHPLSLSQFHPSNPRMDWSTGILTSFPLKFRFIDNHQLTQKMKTRIHLHHQLNLWSFFRMSGSCFIFQQVFLPSDVSNGNKFTKSQGWCPEGLPVGSRWCWQTIQGEFFSGIKTVLLKWVGVITFLSRCTQKETEFTTPELQPVTRGETSATFMWPPRSW